MASNKKIRAGQTVFLEDIEAPDKKERKCSWLTIVYIKGGLSIKSV
jgi:hypothetical protein